MKKKLFLISVFIFASILSFCKSETNPSLEAEISLSDSVSTLSGPKIILKLDDFGSNNTFNSFAVEALDYLISKNKKASLGIVADRLSTDISVYTKYINAKNPQGQNLFELWNHGLTHDKINNVPEFQGPSYSFQKSHFEEADSIIFKRLGIRMHSFGAPYNQVDATTGTVIGENWNYKVCMLANPKPASTFNLNNRVNLEVSAGVLSYNDFVADYESKKTTMSYMVLQGHPYMWDSSEVIQFKKAVDFLISQDCEFVLPYEYYLTNGSPKINVYQNCNYSGWTVALGIGNYTASQLATLGVTTNSISSLLIPFGLKVTLYDNSDFTGVSKILTTNNSCLTSISFDETTSSIKISLN